MNILKCSECGGELIKIGKLLRCQNCKREKSFNNETSTVKEVDMNDDTKNLDVLME
jgi:DNA-directed RNA polymerase subunit M/transcription elongation factor TFIIS